MGLITGQNPWLPYLGIVIEKLCFLLRGLGKYGAVNYYYVEKLQAFRDKHSWGLAKHIYNDTAYPIASPYALDLRRKVTTA